mmetsp:Transcript_4575/g.12933  ORF Transcript_4575/g.12933 Transcript_4575/m.12933 type:complete len:244 (+) Transcript_4575:1986-2717(+)
MLVDRWPSHHLHHHLEARATLIAALDPFLTPFQSVNCFPSLPIHINRAERVAPATEPRCRMQQHLVRRVDPVGEKAAVAVLPHAAPVISPLLLTYPHWIRNTTQNVSDAWAATSPLTTPLPLRTLLAMEGRSIHSIASAMPSCLASNVPSAVDLFRLVLMAKSLMLSTHSSIRNACVLGMHRIPRLVDAQGAIALNRKATALPILEMQADACACPAVDRLSWTVSMLSRYGTWSFVSLRIFWD